MALLSLVTVVLGFISTFGMFIGYEENYKTAVTKTKALNNAAVEYINGIEVIKVFGKADSSYEKFTKAAKEGADAYINWMRKCCNYHCISFSLTPYTLLTVLPFGAVFIMNGTLSVAIKEEYKTVAENITIPSTFNGRTVSRPHALNKTISHRCPIYIIHNNLMGSSIGIGKIAWHLLSCVNVTHKGEISSLFIPWLNLHFAIVKGTAIYSGWGTGFKTHQLNAGLKQRF